MTDKTEPSESVGLPPPARNLNELLAHDGRAFVACLFITVLGRQPDDDALTFYEERVKAGISKLRVVAEVRSSDEAQEKDLPCVGLDAALRKLELSTLSRTERFKRFFKRGGDDESSDQRRLHRLESRLKQFQETQTKTAGRIEDGTHAIRAHLDELDEKIADIATTGFAGSAVGRGHTSPSLGGGASVLARRLVLDGAAETVFIAQLADSVNKSQDATLLAASREDYSARGQSAATHKNVPRFFNTQFRGRIFQLIDSLDFGDAVSGQVIALDAMLKEFGFETRIHSKWHNKKVAEYCLPLEKLRPTDDDIVIYHFSGFSATAMPYLQTLHCTKVCLYHNITPHTHFDVGSKIHEYCLKGRKQLQDTLQDFHYGWADSAYNLQELIDLGLPPAQGFVVPIIVDKGDAARVQMVREEGAWIFLGRVAANKGHLNLVKLFASVRATHPKLARKLYLVGAIQDGDAYYAKVVEQIRASALGADVVVTGKVSDLDVERYLERASIYVSMSEHEGFGVPLIEAVRHDLPVAALRNTAVGETMGETPGLADSADALREQVVKLLSEAEYCLAAMEAQRVNATRFTRGAVEAKLLPALKAVLPQHGRFSTVSVVICTYNREDFLERCLDYLQHQSNQNFEVVVINGPSTDGTEAVLKRYDGRIKVGRNPARNLSISRNMGIELSSGDLIAFIDDDAIPFDDWIDTLLREFGQLPLTVAGIGGPAYFAGALKFQAEDIGINKLAEAKVNIDSAEIGKNGWQRSLLGTNTCFRADVLREIQGFDEQFDYFLDESELCFRLQAKGYLVGYCPNLFLRHEFASSHNRGGQYKFNWFTICKNMAYYIAAYSGLKGTALTQYVEKRMDEERIQHLVNGKKAGHISAEDCDKYVAAVRAGVTQGLADAAGFPRTRALTASSTPLRMFTSAAKHPLVGRDVKSLHICIITREFPPFAPTGGVGTLYYHLASELLLMGHRVTVISPNDHEKPYHCGRFTVRYANRHVVCSDPIAGDGSGFVNNMNWSISALHMLAKVHQSDPVDIVETPLWDTEGLALSLVATAHRPPVVVRLVTPFPVAARLNSWSVPPREASLFGQAEKALIANADAVVPISESIAKTIESEYGIRRDARWQSSYCGIAYWPFFDFELNYADLTEINGRPLPTPADAKLILFVGRLEGRKGVDLLLAAANKFLPVDEKAHLLFAGRDIEGWVEKSRSILSGEIADRVHFVGEVKDATRDKLLNAAYCVVFPSRYESFGLVPLEAFVYGTPVVATRAGAIPEVVDDEKCGLLFDTESADSLAACVSRMLKDAGLRQRLSDGARLQARKFSARKAAIRAVSLYSTLVNARVNEKSSNSRAKI